jgi:hypothetical protein
MGTLEKSRTQDKIDSATHARTLPCLDHDFRISWQLGPSNDFLGPAFDLSA